MNDTEANNEFLASARILTRTAAEDHQVLQIMSAGNAPPDPLWTGPGCDDLYLLSRPRSETRIRTGLMKLMANSEPVSRSQLLLQYLLAVDMAVGGNEPIEPSPGIPEAPGAGGSECLE